MKLKRQQLIIIAWCLICVSTIFAQPEKNFHAWAKTPPMGWNSWDSFGTQITEAQAKEQVDYMAANLKKHGWEYFVVDIQWYEQNSKGYEYARDAELTMDEFSRLVPAPKKFPSAVNGNGFKMLADYVHSKGLKFGIHMMRGIPRQAVKQNTPIKGTNVHAADIADTKSTCGWNPDMYGVDMTKPGAQEYYNSLMELVASWGVDFIKVDDLSRPYHQLEVEAIRKAIEKTGRKIVFSTSPGETPLSAGHSVDQNVNMWRISDDFWDNWKSLLEQFKRLDDWTPYRVTGSWPDADMLPLGMLQLGRKTRFTTEEQYTLMSLWSIARSPLMHGGDMTKTDSLTLSLLTNDEVLAVNQHSENNHQLFRTGDGLIAWIADVPGSKDKYLALFNTQDEKTIDPQKASFKSDLITRQTLGHVVEIPVSLKEIGFNKSVKIRDLWMHKDLGKFNDKFAPVVPFHGACLYRLSPAK